MYPIKERQYSRETIVIRRIDEPQMNTKYISKTPDSSECNSNSLSSASISTKEFASARSRSESSSPIMIVNDLETSSNDSISMARMYNDSSSSSTSSLKSDGETTITSDDDSTNENLTATPFSSDECTTFIDESVPIVKPKKKVTFNLIVESSEQNGQSIEDSDRDDENVTLMSYDQGGLETTEYQQEDEEQMVYIESASQQSDGKIEPLFKVITNDDGSLAIELPEVISSNQIKGWWKSMTEDSEGNTVYWKIHLISLTAMLCVCLLKRA
ncbi:hypothetical protein RDWZM_002801 [Blomia tropicalis]|uniref:Uncharacterized protein n=1 Tax=Blomia tropicalis TaxID=40697 RepID=A0A9Q0RRY7_BLOTA|nr:hypothetical protein RDWZM_002801 [Blomia tropicalis]